MGGKSGGLSQNVQDTMAANSTALTKIAQEQAGHGTQLFETAFPGFQTAEDFYRVAATGDPYNLARITAPAAQAVTKQADAAKKNILQNTAPGGTRNLALEEVEVNRGAQVGGMESQAYLNAFPSLAQLAGQGVNQSISAAGTGISGYGTANQGLASLGNLQIQSAQLQAEE